MDQTKGLAQWDAAVKKVLRHQLPTPPLPSLRAVELILMAWYVQKLILTAM